MPIPLAAILAGSSLAGGVVDAASTANQNKQSQRFSWDMYQRQKADVLEFWNIQNEYNSPQSQMKRYQEAGLNPHLIYGQGSAGNAGAISTPDVQSPQFRTPEWGGAIQSAGLTYMNSIYDLDIKQAQLDNLRAQKHVIDNEAAYKAALIPATTTRTAREQFNLDFESELRPISAEARKEQLRQLTTNIDLSIQKNIREAALASSSVQEAAERILTMKEQRTVIPFQKRQMAASTAEAYERINQMLKDGTLKDLDIELRRQGINPNDPMWSRIVGRILSNAFENSDSGSWWMRLFSGN